MRKGKLGLALNFYAVISFVLFLFGQWVLCGLLCGLVVLVERDEWTSRQCLQAFFLSFLSVVGDWIEGGISGMGGGVLGLLGPLNPMAMLGAVIGFIIWLVILIFALVGVSRVAKGREANLPLASKWAYKAFGYVQNTQNYQANTAGAYPYPPQPPVQQPMQAPMQQPYAPPPAPTMYAPQDMGAPPVYPPQGGQNPPQGM